ncbi:hypothetical protein E2C01_049246 [Portunus trituberculatus]|uniref:Uncharacterized protein n=1 Tax=Portunus trituberculatus TaxID=210409 RepID=A0A5B7GFJ7_PORTR|nr:hypothetical protein [Portunus trituberculatus]
MGNLYPQNPLNQYHTPKAPNPTAPQPVAQQSLPSLDRYSLSKSLLQCLPGLLSFITSLTHIKFTSSNHPLPHGAFHMRYCCRSPAVSCWNVRLVLFGRFFTVFSV